MMNVENGNIDIFKAKMFHMNDMIIGVPTEIGPRILFLASKKRPKINLFNVLPNVETPTKDGLWKMYGGHRLWSSPEEKPRTYSIDNSPVKITATKDSFTIHGNPEKENSILKEITVKPLQQKGIQVIHSIRNIGRWPIQIACWSITIMKQRGFAIIPIKASKVDKDGLLPDRRIVFWPYTTLGQRLKITNEYIFLRQDSKTTTPTKIGASANPVWAAYWVDDAVFVKAFQREEGENPDYGCNVESYTLGEIFELETLGPLRTVDPFQAIQHTETWRILDVKNLEAEPESVKRKLEPLLTSD
jgi:hypothetical protein